MDPEATRVLLPPLDGAETAVRSRNGSSNATICGNGTDWPDAEVALEARSHNRELAGRGFVATEQPEHPSIIEVEIVWPNDSYQDAVPANSFMFTDAGEFFCFAMGFAPPPPNPEETVRVTGDGPGQIKIEIAKPHAFMVPRSMIVHLYTELGRVIAANPHMFGAIPTPPQP
jgi:hypothetical protein